ncbi:PHP domain-containing protein [Candidatus Woesearchaeota archaeon]|nr:PHP domain-containing protein [Candidatus Woesearchaeota archaeon]
METGEVSRLDFCYRKVNITKLKELKYTLVDMHVHTTCSDGLASPEEIIKRAGKLGIGIAVTDHNSISGVEEVFSNDLDILVIPGIEIKTKKGLHMLFYFYTLKELKRFFNANKSNIISNNFSLIGCRKVPEKYKCIWALPHPCGFEPWDNWKKNLHGEDSDYLIKGLHAFEVINGYSTKIQSKESYRIAKANHKGLTGGSDAHKLKDIGNVLTCSKEKDIESFLAAVINRQTRVIGKHSSITRNYFVQQLVRIKKSFINSTQ